MGEIVKKILKIISNITNNNQKNKDHNMIDEKIKGE